MATPSQPLGNIGTYYGAMSGEPDLVPNIGGMDLRQVREMLREEGTWDDYHVVLEDLTEVWRTLGGLQVGTAGTTLRHLVNMNPEPGVVLKGTFRHVCQLLYHHEPLWVVIEAAPYDELRTMAGATEVVVVHKDVEIPYKVIWTHEGLLHEFRGALSVRDLIRDEVVLSDAWIDNEYELLRLIEEKGADDPEVAALEEKSENL